MKTAISIPDTLFEAAETLSARLGISRSELYQRAIGAYLQANRDAGVTEALDQIYGSDDAPSRVDPVLMRLQLASLPKEEW
jgi:metal-responsive CopG/Arc/MetJ family transcriptional regulator